jgi:hypothetical protein
MQRSSEVLPLPPRPGRRVPSSRYRARAILCRLLCISVLVSTCGGVARAQSLQDAQERGLTALAAFADKICPVVSDRTELSDVELTADTKVDLQKLLKVLASGGISTASSYRRSASLGVLQKDLAAAIKVNADCRLAVVAALKDKLIPSASSAPRNSAGNAKGSVAAQAGRRVTRRRPTKTVDASPLVDSDVTGLSTMELLSRLGDPEVSVRTRQNVLERLMTLPLDTLQANAWAYYEEQDDEPVLCVLLDLTRHSNHGVAAAARRVLSLINLRGLVLVRLTSDNEATQLSVVPVLEHLDSVSGARLLGSVSGLASDKSGFLYSALGTKLLVPTASSFGDRYAVRARWVSGNATAVACLGRVFYESLEPPKLALEQQIAKMAHTHERIAYWYSRVWAIHLAQNIRQCGGVADFVADSR